MAKFTRNSSGGKVYSGKGSRTSSSSSRSSSTSSQTTLSNADVKALGALTGKNLSDSSINEARNRANSSGISNANDPINSASMQNGSLIQLPQQQTVKNEMGTILGANASVVNPMMGVTAGQNGMLEYNAPQAEPVKTTAESTFQSYLNSVKGIQDARPSSEDTYNQLYKESGLKNIEKDISNYTGQINNILATAQAQSLGLEGQGRGQTTSFLGGEQARISREAAIQALPLQALLANAQGNKELAQTHLDTRFKIQMQDAQNQFDYDMKVLDSVKSFLDKQEERAWSEVQTEKAQAFELKKGDIAWERQQLSDAMNFNRQIGLLDYKAGLDAKTASQEERVASENGYNQAVTGQEEVQKLLNNKKGLGIITSNLGGIGRFFSSIGNLGKGTRGDEQGGLGAKNDALASARYVLENLTLDKLGKLETPLTPVSNSDVDIVRKASGVLAGYADYKVKGEMSTFKGFKGDLDSVTKAIEDLDTVFKKQIDKNNALIGLTAEEIAALK